MAKVTFITQSRCEGKQKLRRATGMPVKACAPLCATNALLLKGWMNVTRSERGWPTSRGHDLLHLLQIVAIGIDVASVLPRG